MNVTYLRAGVLAMVSAGFIGVLNAEFRAADPGVRGGAAGAGEPLAGLSAGQLALFNAGKDEFEEAEGVAEGLGPRLNLDSCGGCHSQPATGGTSPSVNPQFAFANAFGARNNIPYFVKPDGPVREARFKYHADGSRDGGVHALFVISGRVDDSGNASGCQIQQDDFLAHGRAGNIALRIPTPVFGAGLIEHIPDSAILANARVNGLIKAALGIRGRPNRTGNDGTIARFGWKAQNKSLLIFSGEAYNVEMGVTSEAFPTERDETRACQFASTPNSVTATDAATGVEMTSAVEKFALFMRFLSPPAPSLTTPGGSTSIANGRALFQATGCALCHTPALKTGNTTVDALRDRPVNLYSDLLLHNMGPGLADDVLQGDAAADEFRTAPLWGLGQRIFFLHDGHATNLNTAIQAHRSAANARFAASEANGVVDLFNQLSERQKQDVFNFLRSL